MGTDLPPDRLDVLVISFYYEPDPTGVAPYSAGMARGLAARGHRVRAVVGYPHYPEWRVREGYGGLRMREELDGVEVVRVRHPVPRSSTGVCRALMEAAFAGHAALIRGRRPDVVLVTSPSLPSIATGLAWRRSGRTAVGVIVQDIYSRAVTETGIGGARSAAAVGWVEGALLARADGVAVIHDAFEGVVTELGVPADRVTVIRNWSHIAASTGGRAETRARFGWRDEELIALHSGNMGEKQGLDNVVQAARLAERAGLPVRFVLLGDGSRRMDLQAAAAGLSRLQFVDPQPEWDYPDVLAAADVLVLNEKPGVAEMSVPSKLTSYFAAGRPIVAAVDPASASTREMRAADAGVCVPSGHPDALLDAVLSTADDRVGGERAGARGQAYARAVLSEPAALDSYEDWVRRLSDGRGRGADRAPRSSRRSPAPRG